MPSPPSGSAARLPPVIRKPQIQKLEILLRDFEVFAAAGMHNGLSFIRTTDYRGTSATLSHHTTLFMASAMITPEVKRVRKSKGQPP